MKGAKGLLALLSLCMVSPIVAASDIDELRRQLNEQQELIREQRESLQEQQRKLDAQSHGGRRP